MLMKREQERMKRFRRDSSMSKDQSKSTGLQSGESVNKSRLSSDDYFKQLAYQPREGSIRMVNKISSISNSLIEDDYETAGGKRFSTVN